MTDSLIERVARALYVEWAFAFSTPWDDLPETKIKDDYRKLARVAIDAMLPRCSECGAQGDAYLVCAGCHRPLQDRQ